jgi:hypothetical protein
MSGVLALNFCVVMLEDAMPVSSQLYSMLEESRILSLLVQIGRKIWLLSQ